MLIVHGKLIFAHLYRVVNGFCLIPYRVTTPCPRLEATPFKGCGLQRCALLRP